MGLLAIRGIRNIRQADRAVVLRQQLRREWFRSRMRAMEEDPFASLRHAVASLA
jgi:hypothetical protein